MVVPIGESGELFGLFVFGQKERSKAFTEDNIRYIKALQPQLTGAIANALMYKMAMERIQRMQKAGEILLDKMDCFVIEASQPDQEIGYLLAYAISQKKPLLYLYHKNTPDRVSHGYLNKKNTPEFVCMEEYSRESLEQVLMNFIDDVTSGKGLKQRPTIKFTLRVTPRMERYLEQKAKRSKKTKADYLRDLIEKLMEGEGK